MEKVEKVQTFITRMRACAHVAACVRACVRERVCAYACVCVNPTRRRPVVRGQGTTPGEVLTAERTPVIRGRQPTTPERDKGSDSGNTTSGERQAGPNAAASTARGPGIGSRANSVARGQGTGSSDSRPVARRQGNCNPVVRGQDICDKR